MVWDHPLFASVASRTRIARHEGNGVPNDGWAIVYGNGLIACHPTRRGMPEEWAYVLAHALLHLAFEHIREEFDPHAWNAACCVVVARFLADFKFGRPPEGLQIPNVELPREEHVLTSVFA